MNGNPNRSNMNHDIVATIMTPKETCCHFHSSASAAISKKKNKKLVKQHRQTQKKME